MGGRQSIDDSLVHIAETGVTRAQLVNMMRQRSTDAEHKHLLLCNHSFKKPMPDLPIMPFITHVALIDSVIKNDSILRFNQWCPNVNELTFIRVRLSRSVYEKFASIMIDDDDVMPHVKVFTFHFKDSWDTFGYFVEAMDEKFPSLEEFKLILDTSKHESDLEPTWDVYAPYHPTYFKHLRKLTLLACCNIGESDRILENLDICNGMLEELSFTCVLMTHDNLQWINSCRGLCKLTLECENLDGNDMNELKGMPNLACIKLIVGSIKWQPMEIIEFIRNNQQLLSVSIICGPDNGTVAFDDDFKDAFYALCVESNRNELSVTFTFNKRQGKEYIKITKFDIVETHVPRDSPSDSDDDIASSDEEEYYSNDDDSSDDGEVDDTDSIDSDCNDDETDDDEVMIIDEA